MSVVAVISTKGGAGKSTVVVHLAVAATLKRRRPIIIDFDTKQLSALLWGKGLRKKARTPAIQRGDFSALDEEIAAARRKHDLVIIDVAAGGGDQVRDIATRVEHILVPVRASTFDMAAMRNTIDMLRNSADNTEPEEVAYRNALGKAAIVLNCAPTKRTARWRTEVEDALEHCGAGGVRIVGTLSDREAYSACLEHGQGVTEDGEDDVAVAEIMHLYHGLVEMEKEREDKLKRVRRRK
jgi:chromosome partitioning protein